MVTKKKALINCFLILLGFITSLILLINQNVPYAYQNLFMLPLIQTILLFLDFTVLYNRKLPSFIISISFCIRNIVTPFVMSFGNYIGEFENVSLNTINEGLLLMIVETIVVWIFLFLSDFKKRNNEENEIKVFNLDNKKMLITLSAMFLYIILVFIFIPSALKTYSNIFNSEGFHTDVVSQEEIGVTGLLRVFYTLFTLIVPLFISILSLTIINYLASKYSKAKIKFIYLFLLVLTSCLPVLAMNGSDGFTLITIIVNVIYICYRLPIIRKKIIVFSGLMVSIFALLIIYNRWGDSSQSSTTLTLSSLLQAYFPGVGNFSGVFNVSLTDKEKSLFFDVYYMIPFRQTIFGITGDYRSVIEYTKVNNAISQILPCCGQAFLYIGYLSPIVSCLFVALGQHFFKRAMNFNNEMKYYYLFLTFYSCLIPVMYNVTIFGSWFLSFFILLKIILRLSSSKNKQGVDK